MFLLVLNARSTSAETDGVYDEIELTRLAFGSCSKQVRLRAA